MGIFNASSPKAEALQLLDPVSPPYEAVRGYVRDEQTTLEISKKIMTMKEETSVITDGDGVPVVMVRGPAFWINHFKTVYDPSGTVPLFKMRNKKASLQRLFICEDERGTELFRIQRKWKLLNIKLHATIPSTVGDTPTLELMGNKRGFSAEIRDVHSGALVATVAHSYWRKDMVLKNKEAYFANVAAGVDLAVIVALCLTWDRCKEDDRAASSGGGGD
ncbi:hypothetical protein CcaverHIS002_0207120 [Cutaneotrichosporon cavernicola]|uniref:DUF567-domain-containing protein n=1 Tax=Cutaneotrichosporon cavernicola TaxID=279322 RepID=A0AA48I189_9TREE|nr:uncharacterized protein CcaverHIS019_0207110 [Cutaneotrichosporon cavernicola]BEI81552.1 hypothetical protein CcaverHIS002_0207120 [Cutaneotrichosporon cavernicola]BEI89349.1 hypothetical protein CcaverHIS019_0207110 [Cutaneotrichosporon cavernicola]BEI97124.1 hypothetical protein CcaverHIS631_0207130 [Cutaneotrichosporon cavernicola]BEJ04897.1 hypothetical protein CcaverHIS641_0207140 [Cutaneotrichosporon cavernicola]